MRVAIHQPAYLPYGGIVAKLLRADLFIILDNVLYSRGSFQNRNRILTKQGVKWITVPVHDRRAPYLDELLIDNQSKWAARHWKTVQTVYGKQRSQGLKWIRYLRGERLVDVCEVAIKNLMDLLEQPVPILRATNLIDNSERRLNPDERLIRLTEAVGGGVYISGSHGPRYMHPKRWHDSKLTVQVCQWHQPEYEQIPGYPFEANLSVVDMIGRVGAERTKELIMEGSDLAEWAIEPPT